jgi:hypothetical protein
MESIVHKIGSRHWTFHQRHRCRRFAWMFVAIAIWVFAHGCNRDDIEVAPQPVIRSDKAALAFVTSFFDAFVNVEVEAASRMLCERDSESQLRAQMFIRQSQAPGSPFRIQHFQVRSVVPMWIGSAPFFRVEVAFPKRAGNSEVLHQYRVNAMDGCLESFLPFPNDQVGPNNDGNSDEDGPKREIDSRYEDRALIEL